VLSCLAKHLRSNPLLAANDTFQIPLLRAVVNRIVTLTLPELTCVVSQTVTKDTHSLKLTAERHAATAVEHAADAEDVLREIYSYLNSMKAAVAKLPAGEAKSILQQV